MAPTPPDNHHQHHGRGQREVNNKLHSTHYFKQLSGSGVTGGSSVSGHSHNGDGAGDDGFASLQHHAYKQAQAEYDRQPMLRAESHDNLLKLKSTDKIPPPRPAAVSVDSQVLGKIKASVANSIQQQQQQQHQNKQPNAPNCDTTSSSSSKENKENNNRAAAASSSSSVFPPLKPVALPRTTILGSSARSAGSASNGNNNNDDGGDIGAGTGGSTAGGGVGGVVIREKPVIPERPATLMRPMSFKGSIPEISKVSEGTNTIISGLTSASSLKKAQSFRGETTTGGTRIGASEKPTSSDLERGTLERTQIYNIDKQQVAFIDVVERSSDEDQGSGSITTTKPKHSSTRKDKPEPVALNHVDTLASSSVPATVPQGTPPLAMMESTGSLGSDVQSPVNPLPPSGNNVNNASSTAAANTTSSSSTTTTTSLQHVPQSPRGIDPKIKRPQVPAPPPPVGRPKSSDSTDL